jgi:hypothetical protein
MHGWILIGTGLFARLRQQDEGGANDVQSDA